MKKYELLKDNGQWRYRTEGVEWQWGSVDEESTKGGRVASVRSWDILHPA